MKKILSVIISVIMIFNIILPASAVNTEAGEYDTVTLKAEADTHIQGYSGADINHGKKTSMIVRGKYYRVGLVRFNLDKMPSDFTNAYLRLYKVSGGADELGVGIGSNNWEENSVTFNNYETKVKQVEAISYTEVSQTSGWVYFDVTSAFKEKQEQITFLIFDKEESENNIYFSTTDGGVNSPSIVFDTMYKKEASGIEVSSKYYNQHTISIPVDGSVEIETVATVLDQYGQKMNKTPKWSVTAQNHIGISVDNEGILTVDSAASPQKIQVIAEFSGFKDSYTYTLVIQQNYEKEFPGLMYSTSDVNDIRARMKYGAYKENFDESYKRKDRYTLERLDHAVGIGAWRTQSFSFNTPANTAYIRLKLMLCGSGNIRIDNVKISGIDIPNNSFENATLDCWDIQKSEDSEITLDTQSDTTFKAADGAGKRFVTVINTSNQSEATLTSQLSVEPSKKYSGSIVLGQDVENSDGFHIVVTYLDSNKKVISEEGVFEFNRMTITKRTGLTTMQCANVYLYLGDKTDGKSGYYYAEKAKKMLLYSLWEMRWGMNHYLTTGQSLDDTYEAVHIGRALKNMCYVYDMIKDVPVENGGITIEEENIIREHMFWIADTLMDTIYYDYTSENRRKHNYNADRSIGLIIFAITFPGYYKAEEYYNHAIGEIEWFLENSVGDDGGWPESNRYHVSVLNSIAFVARALKRWNGYDLFANEKVKKMFSFMMETQTPKDYAAYGQYYGCADYPPTGDADHAQMYDCIYAGIEAYAETDRAFSQNLKFALEREGQEIGDWLYDDCSEIESKSPNLSSRLFEDMGYAVFRQDYGLETEDYAFYSSSPVLIGSHQHEDRGGFTIYSDNTAISVDSGMSDYGSSTASWYESPEAHNTVTFYDDSGNEYSGPTKAEITQFYSSKQVDYVKSCIDGKGNTGYNRNFAFIKNGIDAYVIWDDIEGSVKSRFGFHALAENVVKSSDNSVTALCRNEKEAELFVMQPQTVEFQVSDTPLSNTEKYNTDSQKFITVQADDGDDYLVAVDVRNSGEESINISLMARNLNGGEMYQIERGDKKCYVIINRTENSMNFPAPEQLADRINKKIYKEDEVISVEGKEMKILFPHSTEELQLLGLDEAQNNTGSYDFSAYVYNGLSVEKSIDFYVGVYDKNGRLTKVFTQKDDVMPGKIVPIIISGVEKSAQTTIKTFLWNNMKPIN